MRCRLGVRKHLQGGKLPFSAEDKQLLTVYDIEKKGYRSIPLDNLLDIKIRKVNYKPKQLERALQLFGIGEQNNG